DFNEAIRLDPKNAFAYNIRGNAWRDKGELDRAIADFNEVIKLNPKSADAYLNRGITYLYSHKLAKSLADANQANELEPKDAFNALWMDIAIERNGLARRLSQGIAVIDMTKWPAPIVRLFLGQSTPESVLAAADNRYAMTKKVRICVANFYSGIA